MQRFQMALQPGKNGRHVVIHAVSIGLAVIAQMILSIFVTLTKDSFVPDALFQTPSWNVSETFSLEVSMDRWSGGFWIMIDLWSLGWLLHATVGLFNRNVLGPESCNPEIHPPSFYLMWVTINIARVCSMVLWHTGNLVSAVQLWWTIPVFSFFMLSISYYNVHKHKAWLAINTPRLATWTRYLTQNGLAVFAWWSLLNAVVGLGVVLKYKGGVQDPLISAIVLAIICVCALTWFLLQTFLLHKYLRYTFCVYPILVLGLGAMFTRSYRVHNISLNTSFCGCLMLLMTCMSVVHLICECMRTDDSGQPLAVEPYVTSGVCETVCQPDAKHKPQKC
ncbi:uncharacterized protein LOC115569716 [Sparus aurata]|uniref:uncharacterized protein LOC115569716 n=1 Tax=Sparus aurata TaxID=8175 RepID=UPI0011C1645A|nr:uncharacterized protein LOC115569716 [Sparus aurata]